MLEQSGDFKEQLVIGQLFAYELVKISVLASKMLSELPYRTDFGLRFGSNDKELRHTDGF